MPSLTTTLGSFAAPSYSKLSGDRSISGFVSLTYNGREQTLVTRGTAVNGHMEYSFDEYDDYGTALPKGINAGIYEVWYKVVGDDASYSKLSGDRSISGFVTSFGLMVTSTQIAGLSL